MTTIILLTAISDTFPIPDTTYPKKKKTVSFQNPTLLTPSSPKHPGTDAEEDPHHQSRVKLRLSMLISPPSTARRSRPRRTYRAPVDRSISLRHLHALVSIRTAPTSSRGGPRATTHWPQSGNHPSHLLTIPRLAGELPTSLQIHTRVSLLNCNWIKKRRKPRG